MFPLRTDLSGPTHEALDIAITALTAALEVIDRDSPCGERVEAALETLQRIVAMDGKGGGISLPQLIDCVLFELWRA